MPDVLSDQYWQEEFDITTDDLDRIVERMRKEKRAFMLTEMVKRLVRGRLEYGRDDSPIALPTWVEEMHVKLWDPAGKWKPGDGVVVAYMLEDVDEELYEARVGEIVSINGPYVEMRVDGVPNLVTHKSAPAGSEDAKKWHQFVKDVVLHKEESVQQKQHAEQDKAYEDQVELIMMVHGDRVATRFKTALLNDARFVQMEEKWFLNELCIKVSQEQLTTVYQSLLDQREPSTVSQLIQWVHPKLPEGDIGLFSLFLALLEQTDLFENTSTPGRPLWKAIPPPPPPWQDAIGKYYVYDPDNYTIILEPGKPLRKQVAERLERLGWYRDMVTKA